MFSKLCHAYKLSTYVYSRFWKEIALIVLRIIIK